MTSDRGPDPSFGEPFAEPRWTIRLKELAELAVPSPQAGAAPLAEGRLEESDLSAALDLIARAAAAIPELQRRSEEMESIARNVLDRTREKLAIVRRETEELRQLAIEGEARAVEAERRLVEAERRAQEADHVATHAARSLARFHEEVVRRLAPACEAVQRYQREAKPSLLYETWPSDELNGQAQGSEP